MPCKTFFWVILHDDIDSDSHLTPNVIKLELDGGQIEVGSNEIIFSDQYVHVKGTCS